MSQSYTDELKTTFGRLIDGTDLGDRERQFLKLRWLDQVLWMESKAGQEVSGKKQAIIAEAERCVRAQI